MFKTQDEDKEFLDNFCLDFSRRFESNAASIVVPRQSLFFFSILSVAALWGRYTQPPRAMIAAQSKMMTTAPSSP
jgi:hypothetical protein